MTSLHHQAALAQELLDAAARDLAAYADEGDINRTIAGEAALREVVAAIHVLTEVRGTLGAQLDAERLQRLRQSPARGVAPIPPRPAKLYIRVPPNSDGPRF